MTLPDLSGSNWLITGANTGIGRVTAVELARAGAHVILACRSLDRTQPVLDEIAPLRGSAEFVALDLGDLDSVRACAEQVRALDLPLRGLIANAGLAGHRGETKQGFEIQFGVNHVGHYLFVRLLLDQVGQVERAGSAGAAEPARIVIVASKAHYKAEGIDWGAVRGRTRSVAGFSEYCVAKLANVLFAAELARRLEGSGVNVYSLHPGVVATDVWRRIPKPIRWLVTRRMITPEEGARTSLYCATSPECAGESGLYYDDCRARKPSRLARDEALAKELWDRSAEWVGLDP